MNTVSFLLLAHIAVAVASLIYAAVVINASYKQQIEKASSRTKTMWFNTVFTVLSGLTLLPLGKGALGRTCITLSLFLVVVGVAHYYQKTVKRRMIQSTQLHS